MRSFEDHAVRNEALQITPLAIPGVLLLKPPRFGDDRGYFSETFHLERFAEAGIADRFVQDNESLSRPIGTVRGLHFQIPPFAQAKLVRVVQGAVFDVAVDIRRGSPTFGQHVTAELTAEEGHQLFIPTGFAHGFCTLIENTTISYKVSAYYSRDHDQGLAWDDPDLGVGWPVTAEKALLSEKDRVQPRLRDFLSPFGYNNGS